MDDHDDIAALFNKPDWKACHLQNDSMTDVSCFVDSAVP